MQTNTIVTLDLGATKCAAGIITYHQHSGELICEKSCTVKLADTASLPDLIKQIEIKLNITLASADAVCIGAAGQFNGSELLHLTGVYPYPMRFGELAAGQRWRAYAVIHDYDSVVCATFTTYMQQPDNILALNQCLPLPYKRRVALGLGSGLGLKDGVLLQNGDFWLGKNEIGHIGIINPPLTTRTRLLQHQQLMQFLYTLQAHANQQITFENILTGRGLAHLHQFLYPSRGVVTPEIAGNEMAAGNAPELQDLFAWYLGLFVGSVQLIFMPEGGLWITGGVAIKHLDLFQQSAFTEGIQASPAFRAERELYPLGVMKNPEHALIGAGYYAAQRLLQGAK